MFYIDKDIEVIYEINKSKFIATVCPFKDFEEKLKIIKENHPKASHYVWAYRYEISSSLFEKANDDGEPQGCAGKPILNILQKLDFINTAIIVSRYFGGVKLGAGGLIRAYSNSAKLSIENSTPKIFLKLEKITKTIPLKNLDLFRHLMKEYEIIQEDIQYNGNSATITISALKDQLYSFILEIKDLIRMNAN